MVCCNAAHIAEFWAPLGRWNEKPWGGYVDHFRSDDKSICYKTLVIQCGHQISVQYHLKRAEMWYIADENSRFELTLGQEKKIYSGQKRIDIPKLLLHSIRNINSIPLIIYETQYGECLEDDIVRTYDPYNRQAAT